jgi:peptidyl-tRNA hydrolase
MINWIKDRLFGKPETHKMYVVVSREIIKKMNGIRGKIINQGGHAILHSFWDSEDRFPSHAKAYRKGRAFKIVVVVDTEQELRDLEQSYRDVCGVSLVVDAGATVFNEPTVTYLGIGPIPVSKIKSDLADLKPLC